MFLVGSTVHFHLTEILSFKLNFRDLVHLCKFCYLNHLNHLLLLLDIYILKVSNPLIAYLIWAGYTTYILIYRAKSDFITQCYYNFKSTKENRHSFDYSLPVYLARGKGFAKEIEDRAQIGWQTRPVESTFSMAPFGPLS